MSYQNQFSNEHYPNSQNSNLVKCGCSSCGGSDHVYYQPKSACCKPQCCAPNPCGCGSCKGGDRINTSTIVNKSVVINNYDHGHRIPYHRGYVEPSHCGCGCGSTSDCGCSKKTENIASCLDATLFCDNNDNTATIKSGVVGQVLAKLNGQFYMVNENDVVSAQMLGDALNSTCSLPVLLINGNPVTQADIYNQALSTDGCLDCPKLTVTESFSAVNPDTSETETIQCNAVIEFFLVS